MPRLKQVLRAKAVLCPNLRVTLLDKIHSEEIVWQYENGLTDYLKDTLQGADTLPAEPFVGQFRAACEEAEWALAWLNAENGRMEPVAESYANLITTPQGIGTSACRGKG